MLGYAYLDFDIIHVWVDAEGEIAGEGPGSCGPRHHTDNTPTDKKTPLESNLLIEAGTGTVWY